MFTSFSTCFSFLFMFVHCSSFFFIFSCFHIFVFFETCFSFYFFQFSIFFILFIFFHHMFLFLFCQSSEQTPKPGKNRRGVLIVKLTFFFCENSILAPRWTGGRVRNGPSEGDPRFHVFHLSFLMFSIFPYKKRFLLYFLSFFHTIFVAGVSIRV